MEQETVETQETEQVSKKEQVTNWLAAHKDLIIKGVAAVVVAGVVAGATALVIKARNDAMEQDYAEAEEALLLEDDELIVDAE